MKPFLYFFLFMVLTVIVWKWRRLRPYRYGSLRFVLEMEMMSYRYVRCSTEVI